MAKCPTYGSAHIQLINVSQEATWNPNWHRMVIRLRKQAKSS